MGKNNPREDSTWEKVISVSGPSHEKSPDKTLRQETGKESQSYCKSLSWAVAIILRLFPILPDCNSFKTPHIKCYTYFICSTQIFGTLCFFFYVWKITPNNWCNPQKYHRKWKNMVILVPNLSSLSRSYISTAKRNIFPALFSNFKQCK